MTLPLGQKLQIRAMIYVAGEPIPYFWPMRSFIHHNPLHGLEHLPFAEAVEEGKRVFHARGFLKRTEYQRYLGKGKVDQAELAAGVEAVRRRTRARAGGGSGPLVDGPAEANRWSRRSAKSAGRTLRHTGRVDAAVRRTRPRPTTRRWSRRCAAGCWGPARYTRRSMRCMGPKSDQSSMSWSSRAAWISSMKASRYGVCPGVELGFFEAWRNVASHNGRLYLRGLHINRVLADDEPPEGVIAHVMQTLGVPPAQWVSYFTRELARLHGWAGFIRWRSNARHYYWAERYPADLVDFMAVRLTLALALLSERGRRGTAASATDVARAIDQRPHETYLRHELYSGSVLPALAARVDQTLAGGRAANIDAAFHRVRRRETCR